MVNCVISSKKFLEEVKIQIKKQFRNQDSFAGALYISRKQLNRILNNPDKLNVYWINEFARYLGMDLEESLFIR